MSITEKNASDCSFLAPWRGSSVTAYCKQQ